MAGGAELEEHLRAPCGAPDPELQRGAQPHRRLVERDRGGGCPGGLDVVFDAALRVVQGRGGGEVMRQVRQGPARPTLGALERLSHAQVHLGAPHPGEPVVERAAHELVREPVGEPAGGQLLDHAAADGLVEGGEEVGLAQARGLPDDVEPELRAGGGGQLQKVGRRRRQAREPLADDLAHALGCPELRQRPGGADRAVGHLDDACLHQCAPQLADQERVAAGELADRPGELGRPGAGVAFRGVAQELADVVVGEAGEAQAHDVVGAAQVGERLRDGVRESASVSRKVASRSTRALPAARARWRRSRSVEASAQCPSSSTSSTGRALSPTSSSVTAVCRRWRSVSASALTGADRSPTRAGRSGSRRVSSPPDVPSATRSSAGSTTRAACSSASTNGPYGVRTTASQAP